MNRSNKIAMGMALLSSVFFVACNMDNATEVDTTIDLQGGKALYGVWEASTKYDLSSSHVTSWNLYFTDSACYLIREIRGNPSNDIGWDSLVSGSDGGGFVVRTAWSADSNKVTFQKNPYAVIDFSSKWTYLSSAKTVDGAALTLRQLSSGIGYRAYTYTSLDSLAWGLGRSIPFYAPSDTLDSVSYVYVPKAPYEFVVLSIQDDAAEGTKAMHITDKPCYEKHSGASNIDKLCEVRVFYKRERAYFSEVIQQMDTISTTDAFFPVGTSSAIRYPVTIHEVPRGGEWW